VWFCTAEVGWITGHSYMVYGPLANGVTSVMYEGALDYPHKGIWWELVDRSGATVFYTAPTAIRACMKWGAEFPNSHELTSLRLLGTVGEPINPKAWLWYQTVIGRGRCPIVDTWWQPETGAIMIRPLPGLTATKPGSATLPLPGISTEVESAIVAHEKVAESAVVAQSDDLTGQSIVAFVTLTGELEGDDRLEAEIREQVAERIGKLAAPSGSSGLTTCPRHARAR
jgi:acyl-coenzyme A synthetase/AMP-(fatty) acid ligase